MKLLMSVSAVAVLLAMSARAEAPAKLPGLDDAVTVEVADAKWIVPPIPGFPAGPLASPIAVDPATGAQIGYVKLPAGFKFPEHWHSTTEYATVISGKATLIIEGKAHEEQPGSYAVLPPKTKHSVQCAAGADCILIVRRSGKTDYNWVK